MLPWGLDQGLKSSNIESESFCSDPMLQICLKDTNCRNDYRVVFLQVAKALGTQGTALLTLAKLAAKQVGKDGASCSNEFPTSCKFCGIATSCEQSHKNIETIITSLGEHAT